MLSKLCAEQGIPASNPERERAGLERTCHQSLNLWSFEQSDPESYWVVRRSRLRVCGSLNHWKYLPLRLLGKLQFLFRIMWRAWKLPNCDWREFLWLDSSSSATIEESCAFLTETVESCWQFDKCFMLLAELLPQDLNGNDLFLRCTFTHTTKWVRDRAHFLVEICSGPEQMMPCSPPSEKGSVGGKPTCVQLILLCKECSGCVFTVWSYFPIWTNQAKPFFSLLTQSTTTETQILVSERGGPCCYESCLPSR